MINKSSINTWLGELKLQFSSRGGKSILTKCKHSGPFIVQKSFYPEEDRINPHIYLLHPSGGLVGGDELVLDVQLESNSQALLTTIGASKFYRTNGLCALQKNTFRLASNAFLEWVPQNTIFFSRSKATIDTTFILENGARIIALETLCFNNIKSNFSYSLDEINVSLNINLPDSIGLKERLRLKASDYVIKLGGFKISVLFFVIPSNKKMLCQVRELMGKELINDHCQIGGVTLLDNLLVIRLLGNDNQNLRKLICCIWDVVRFILVGKNVIIPRIWYT